ncbi:hypothetical protein [Legionella tunisiensis]|uniref:hypothetical protein n=1 Tax=Legionella tunisiensis TaxID=1034944 RepID=UPI00030DED05|nr:hypothetical protein [Legionella tunisiensis]
MPLTKYFSGLIQQKKVQVMLMEIAGQILLKVTIQTVKIPKIKKTNQNEIIDNFLMPGFESAVSRRLIEFLSGMRFGPKHMRLSKIKIVKIHMDMIYII